MQDKDKLVYRILSGKVRIKVDNQIFYVYGPNAYYKYLAEEIFSDLIEQHSDELMSDDELMDWLLENEYWSLDEEDKLKKFRADIEEFQLKLYELGFRGEEKNITKRAIQHARGQIKELTAKRHSFDYLSYNGAALIEKNKYLIGLGLADERGQRLFNELNFFANSFGFFDRIVVEYNKVAITVSDFRYIARNEPWRQYWGAKESATSVFGIPATEMTDEQLSLISWSRLYDSVYQHPKCPPEDVIEDDDALDGFFIKERRERQVGQDRQVADDLIKDPKIKQASEVFIMAGNDKEAANRINNLNTEAAKSTKRQRDTHIEKHGIVKEAELPDVKRRLQMEINAAKFS